MDKELARIDDEFDAQEAEAMAAAEADSEPAVRKLRATREEKERRTVFVGNLPLTMAKKPKKLKSVFRDCGE